MGTASPGRRVHAPCTPGRMTLPVASRKICPACLLRLAAIIVVLSTAWNRHRRKPAARPPRKPGSLPERTAD